MRSSTQAMVCILAVLGMSLLSGCGGSDSSGSSNGLINNAQFTVDWPTRSRDLEAPNSALSFRFIMNGAAQDGTDVTVNENRPAGTAASTSTYTLPQGIKPDSRSFTIRFFGGNAQTGAVVGEATGTADLSGNSIDIGTVALEGTVATVTVPNSTISVGSDAAQLTFTAQDADSNTLALSLGSAEWRLADGASFATVTPAGLVTGQTPGTAHVIARVDGVDSNAASLIVEDVVEDGITAVAIDPTGDISGGGQLVGSIGMLFGTSKTYLYDFTTEALNEIPGGRMSPDRSQFLADFYVEAENAEHAAVRTNGPMSTVIDLHPGGMTRSGTSDLTNFIQVGEVAKFPDFYHAAKWSGTKESFVDLHPTDALNSTAVAVSGDVIGGSVYYPGDGRGRAMVWKGTSPTNIHPATWDRSGVSVVGSQFVGGVVTNVAGNSYPCIWNHNGSGFAVLDSVDAGARIRELGQSTNVARFAVGYKQYDDFKRYAVIWNVETKKVINLDEFSPFGSHRRSEAISISTLPGGAGVRVLGRGEDLTRSYAIAWTIPNSVLATIDH